MSSKKPENRQLRAGLLLAGVILICLSAAVLFNGLSIRVDMDRRMDSASPAHPLGADHLGRDLLSCIVYGTGVSLAVGVTVVLFSGLIGVLCGMIAGMAGGVIDTIIMRITDVFLAFPGILLAISLAAFCRQGFLVMILVLTVSGWAGYARIVRGEVLKYKHTEFIANARCYNASTTRIIFHHLLPLCLPLVVVQASIGISGVILAESGLNFLGLGLPPQIPTLGQLIDAGRFHISNSPRLIILPGSVLFLVIISLQFIGEGLRKKFTR